MSACSQSQPTSSAAAPPPGRRRVQFARSPRVLTSSHSMSSTAPSGLIPSCKTSPLTRPPTEGEDLFGAGTNWRRASAAIICGLESKKKKVQTWRKISSRIEKRRQRELEDQIANYSEAHLPALDKGAVRRSTCRIAERKRVKSAPADKAEEPGQPEDVRQRPSTELKNRLQEYQLPISYNNFIVSQLELRFRGQGYDVLRTS